MTSINFFALAYLVMSESGMRALWLGRNIMTTRLINFNWGATLHKFLLDAVICLTKLAWKQISAKFYLVVGKSTVSDSEVGLIAKIPILMNLLVSHN